MGIGHGHGHRHGHDDEPVAVRADAQRLLGAVAALLAVLTVVGLVLLRPTGEARSLAEEVGLASERYRAEVVGTASQPCSFAGEGDRRFCLVVDVRPSGGSAEGQVIRLAEFDLGDPFVPRLAAGDDIVVAYEPTTDTYAFADRERRFSLGLLALVFAVAVILVGRLRGVAALAALAGTVMALLQFVAPAVLDGRSPLLVALVGASAIAFFVLYLGNGFSPTTTVALLGTLGALGVTAGLGSLFFEMGNFSGAASEEATYLPAVAGAVDVRGLLLGGIIIGALGALDDMTVTQASAVWEIRRAAPRMSAGALYRSAMRIGRDHIGSTVNTLLLAYAGAGMPLMLLFVLSRQSLGTVANTEEVAIEIVRTLVGSIGLVVAVPLTTALAAWVSSPGDLASWKATGDDSHDHDDHHDHDERHDEGATNDEPTGRLAPLWRWLDRRSGGAERETGPDRDRW